MEWHILLIDENTGQHKLLAEELRRQGFEVSSAYSGREALEFIQNKGLPHLAVANLKLGDMGGAELAERITRRGAPVILLADNSPKAAINSLRWADDFVRRPVDPEEVVARIRRVLSRITDYSYAEGPSVEIDQRVTFDYARSALMVEGKRVPLTPIEARLLHTLLQQRGNPVDSRTILMRVWPSEEAYEDTLRVHIHRLRRKLEKDARNPKYILTERGIGYSFGS